VFVAHEHVQAGAIENGAAAKRFKTPAALPVATVMDLLERDM
jgi:hypothetical protein